METFYLTTRLNDLLDIEISNKFNSEIKQKRDNIYKPSNKILNKYKHFQSLNEIDEFIESGRFSVNINNVLFNFLFNKKQNSKKLYVIYNGAKGKHVPSFPRWSYYNLFDGNYLGIDDPMYIEFPSLKISWFYGNKYKSYLHKSILLIHKISEILNINQNNIIFFSSSGGGYDSIYASTLINNTLSISINPQLYINKYPYADEFKQITGIDLNSNDELNRNNLIRQIKTHPNSRHVIIINSFDRHHFNYQLLPFAKELGITLKYGITIYKNILIWIYSVNNANPHTAFESKALFSAIDFISKEFKNYNPSKLKFTDRFQNFSILCNEIWNDIYNSNKNFKKIIIDCNNQLLNENSCLSFNTYRIKTTSNDSINNYHYYTIENLNINTLNTIIIKNTDIKSCNFSYYNVSIYNKRSKKDIKLYTFSVKEDAIINFLLHEGNEDISIYIYTGLRGKTLNNYFYIKNIKHFIYPLT